MLALKHPRRPSAVQVSFQFDEAPAYGPSVIETAARAAHSAVINSGSDADQFAFFQSSKAADWFSGMGVTPDTEPDLVSRDANQRRLRSITCGSQTLMECSYGNDGRLANIHYFNGEAVSYEHDDLSRTRMTRTRSGRQVAIKSRADDLIESIIYDNNAAFRYEYDNDHNVTRLDFPDGKALSRTFTPSGDVSTMNCAGVSSRMRWSSPGCLEGYELFSGQDTFTFRADARHHRCDLAAAVSPANGYFPIFHALGAWRTSGPKLEEMLTPWGDRFRILATSRNQPTTTWSPNGQKTYVYSNDGSVTSIMHRDGTLSAFYSFDDGLRTQKVHPSDIRSCDLTQSPLATGGRPER